MLELLKDKAPIIAVNKVDLNPAAEGIIKISALNNDISALIEEIKRRYAMEELKTVDTLQSQRQVGLMKQAKQALENAIESLTEGRELELVAIDLNIVYQCLSDILGRYNRLDLLDSIFHNFCLGK